MNKAFNTMRGGFEKALANLHRHRIRVYGTFIFGYDRDTPEIFTQTVAFAKEHALYIAAFNHLTPFPGTPLYARLQTEGRLLYERWWLDDRYSYNRIPFQPRGMTPDALQQNCLASRREFYSWRSIASRSLAPVNRSDWFMWRNFYLINALHRNDVSLRDHYPLGDESWQRTIRERELTVAHSGDTCFSVANEMDDPDIRRLLRENPMPGKISISLEREPDFFADTCLPAQTKQTIVARSRAHVICVGSCTFRQRFVNGEPRRVGYLGGLRLDESHAGRFDVLRRGYEFFHALQADAPADFYFTSIAADNQPARHFLERGLRGMPRYEFIGEFVTLLLPTIGAAHLDSASGPPSLERSTLVAKVNQFNRHYQFAPCWSADELAAVESLGLRADDFLLTEEEGRFEACAALWDQRSFKQTVIRDYDPVLKQTRTMANFVSKLVGTANLAGHRNDTCIRNGFTSGGRR